MGLFGKSHQRDPKEQVSYGQFFFVQYDSVYTITKNAHILVDTQ